jgi:hypothetical protein
LKRCADRSRNDPEMNSGWPGWQSNHRMTNLEASCRSSRCRSGSFGIPSLRERRFCNHSLPRAAAWARSSRRQKAGVMSSCPSAEADGKGYRFE